SERQLQESEGKFRDFADHLPQMVFETDMDLKITYVNKYTVDSYAFPADAVGSGLKHPHLHSPFPACHVHGKRPPPPVWHPVRAPGIHCV
ncbi:MAG TPA: PAS domain-containing protein, partial [Methanoregula sp.]|nr:PAS domain-containing protein [Methanoregula sp.]